MRRLLPFVTATLAGLCAARAETLVASLSAHQIAITSNYTGAELTVFGLIERDGRTVARATPYDLVVTVRGPRRLLRVREKERIGPVWINRSQRRFDEAPVYMNVASNRPLADILAPDAAKRESIGLANATRSLQFADSPELGMLNYRDALLRIMSAKGLYAEREHDVRLLTPALFSAPIPVTATAPTGTYEVEVLLLSGGVVLARQSTGFEVVKSGIEQRLATAAFDRPWLYGLATALMALAFGWLASVIFRRD